MNTVTNFLLIEAKNPPFFIWTRRPWSQKGRNERCVTYKWNTIFIRNFPFPFVPGIFQCNGTSQKIVFDLHSNRNFRKSKNFVGLSSWRTDKNVVDWERHWATQRPGTRKTTRRLDHRSQSRREWIWRRFGWILRWLTHSKKQFEEFYFSPSWSEWAQVDLTPSKRYFGEFYFSPTLSG